MIPALLNVLKPIGLVYFRTNKPVYGPGETVWISWKVTGVWNVEINGSKYSSQGVLKLEKCSISTFTLRAYSEKEPIYKSIQVVFSENSLVTLSRRIDTRVAELAKPQASFLMENAMNSHSFGRRLLKVIRSPFGEIVKNRKFNIIWIDGFTSGFKRVCINLRSINLKSDFLAKLVNGNIT